MTVSIGLVSEAPDDVGAASGNRSQSHQIVLGPVFQQSGEGPVAEADPYLYEGNSVVESSKNLNPGTSSGSGELAIKCGKWQREPHREFEVGRIVYGQPMIPGQRQYRIQYSGTGIRIDIDR